MHPLIHPPSTHSSIQPSNRLFIHPPIYSSVHPALSIHRFIHPFIKPHKIICLFTETGLEKKKHTISHTHTADKKYNEELSIHTHTHARTHARTREPERTRTSIHHSIHLSACQFIHQSVHPSIKRSIHQSALQYRSIPA